mmetsp:Transcript_37874/g.83104  ORF Transcript_37874/g.83104 Transcript_37874/m.83104 type:complete len:395 (-) Transcript_37874:769-1953(-)
MGRHGLRSCHGTRLMVVLAVWIMSHPGRNWTEFLSQWSSKVLALRRPPVLVDNTNMINDIVPPGRGSQGVLGWLKTRRIEPKTIPVEKEVSALWSLADKFSFILSGIVGARVAFLHEAGAGIAGGAVLRGMALTVSSALLTAFGGGTQSAMLLWASSRAAGENEPRPRFAWQSAGPLLWSLLGLLIACIMQLTNTFAVIDNVHWLLPLHAGICAGCAAVHSGWFAPKKETFLQYFSNRSKQIFGKAVVTGVSVVGAFQHWRNMTFFADLKVAKDKDGDRDEVSRPPVLEAVVNEMVSEVHREKRRAFFRHPAYRWLLSIPGVFLYAFGGGVLRDLLNNRVPAAFSASAVLPMFVGVLCCLGLHHMENGRKGQGGLVLFAGIPITMLLFGAASRI